MPPRLGAFLAIVFWGLSFVATKAALRELSPITLIATRFALGLALLLVLLRAQGGRLGAAGLAVPATRGDLLILASTLNWAIYSVLGHPVLKRLGATRATAGALLFGWLMLLPLFVVRGGWREYAGLSLAGGGAGLFLGIACSGLGYLFWYGALEKGPASAGAALPYLEPLVPPAPGAALPRGAGHLTTGARLAGGLAQGAVELELEDVREEVARVGNVGGHVVLGPGVEVGLAARHGRRYALIPLAQRPPRGVVVGGAHLAGEDLPAPLVDEEAEGQEGELVECHLQEEADVL